MSERLTFAGTIAAEGRRLKGSVRIAGQQTPRNGEMVELDLNALHRADRTGAVMVVGHQAFDAEAGYDPLRTVARLDNQSLTITPTPDGFDYETADLPNTTYANDALELARTGVFGGTSFDIFGLRSQVRVEPGNVRVRRYTSIAKFGAVTPVVEPAFPSSVAAFSKETDVADEITPEAPAPEAPKPAQFSETPKSGRDEWAAFAKDLSTEQIQSTMDQVFSAAKGDPRGELLDRYEGFAQELQNRKRTQAQDRARIERMELEHNLRLGRVPQAPEAGLLESSDYMAAFGRYIRGDLRSMEQFAQSVSGDGTQGGFTVPDGFLAKVTTRQKAYGGIAGIADEITTSTGESLRWPYLDDTGNKAAIATEGVAVASGGADLIFDSIELGAFEYDATGTGNNPLKISLTLLQDSAIDIESRIADALGTRIGRKQADDLATGTGVNQPFGLLSKTADVMTATAVSLAGPEHIFQVDRAYRDNARWVMSDTTLAKLWTSQATTNEPLFQPGRTLDGKPFDMFFGYPITIDAAAGNLVAFGDIKAGYIVRRVRGIQLLVDPYTAQSARQVAYHAWARMDAAVQDASAYSVSTWSGVSADT